MSPLSNSSSLEIISYVNNKKLSVFQKTADSSNEDPPSQQKMTEEENEKVSMPFGGGDNNYMRLLVVSWCWGCSVQTKPRISYKRSKRH